MSWRSKEDGTHFQLNANKPTFETFAAIQSQDINRNKPTRKLSIKQRMKSSYKIKSMRMQAFLHYFSKVADPYGLQWLVATGRSDYDVERKMADLFGYNSFPQRDFMDAFRSEMWTFRPNPKVANDPELKNYAEQLASWLKNRYPLYQPRKRDLED